MKLWHVPIRISVGVFLIHTAGMKRNLDSASVAGLYQFGVSGYPILKRVPPETFVKGMRTYETALIAALLIPAVPSVVGGMGVGVLGSALVGLYLRVPGMRRQGSLRPTLEGMAVAKDSWLVAMGAALVLDSLSDAGCKRQVGVTPISAP